VVEHLSNASVLKVELYDMDADPGERTDVSPEQPTRVAHMRSLLDRVRRETVRVPPPWNLDCVLPNGAYGVQRWYTPPEVSELGAPSTS
jgi:hypothetical protein